MEESERKEEFKVSDKRRFTTGGEKREDEQAESPSDKEQRVEELLGSTVDEASKPSESERESGNRQQQPPPPLDFSTFILSMANTALFQLGLIKLSEEEEPRKDLQAARQTIDLISLLEEKTRGNLTEAEKKVLSETLFQLRMAFVEASK
ncbi:MAG: DUF1844 domain-containing protein [Desulfomonilaceae bacterium]|nr:DUF1844 domain-containing protein [Desulfomonilaceae bacterium]